MTFQQELSSWFAPKSPAASEPPQIGSKAPDTPRLGLKEGRPAVLTFLRHCGCPWAERAFLKLREAAAGNPEIEFIAVSHSDQSSTAKWLKALPQAGSEPSNLRVIVDEKTEIYAAWGLGPAGWTHVLSPSELWNTYKLGREDGVKIRPTESGSRWQKSGSFAVDAEGVVRWGGPASKTSDVPDFQKAVESVGKS